MTEFTNMGGQIGRSIHDCPDDRQDEIEAERAEVVMARVSRTDLESALVIMLGAARQAEGQALELERALHNVVSKRLKNNLENLSDQLIREGIDRVVDLLGAEAVEILEEQA
jgi:hypothetical protein